MSDWSERGIWSCRGTRCQGNRDHRAGENDQSISKDQVALRDDRRYSSTAGGFFGIGEKRAKIAGDRGHLSRMRTNSFRTLRSEPRGWIGRSQCSTLKRHNAASLARQTDLGKVQAAAAARCRLTIAVSKRFMSRLRPKHMQKYISDRSPNTSNGLVSVRLFT